MRSKVFSIALGALVCTILALPAAAQEGRGASVGIFQEIYEAMFAWFGGADGDLEVLANSGSSAEVTPVIMPGGIQGSDEAADNPPRALTGEPSSPPALESGPLTMPGG